MKNKQEIPNRRSIRLKEFDYTTPNAYFITIVTKDRECFLGTIENEEALLSEEGKIVLDVWNRLPKHYPNVLLDAFIVMPNHIHGILILIEPDDEKKKYPVSEIVRGLKSLSSRLINRKNNSTGTSRWQRNYYEHIIRDEEELHEKREYIIFNANKWNEDSYFQ